MKKELNNKGFTLVELLATVVILLAISTIAVTSISAAMDRQNEKKDKEMLNMIISYGRNYLEEHKNTTSCVNILSKAGGDNLEDIYGLGEATLKKSSDNNYLDGSIRYVSGDYEYFTSRC